MTQQETLKLLALASEFKEGDLLVGGTRDEKERLEARGALSRTRIGDLASVFLVEDSLSEALARSLNHGLQSEVSGLTIYQLKDALLGPGGLAWAEHYRNGLASEAIASVVKLMTDDELSTVARTLFNPLPGAGMTVGSPQHFGSRIQPNSPSDDEEEILLSILEGLAHGCGDVIIGLNPAGDDLDTIVRLEQLLRRVVERLELPTRYSVLSDIVKQTAARARVKVDVGFQSLAGTSKAIRGMVGLDVDGLLDLAGGFSGLYFETGQGSAVTNAAAEGVDMVTLEARAYGLARYLGQKTGAWTIVNDVAGFIGPEVFRSPDQLARACLEDLAMAKLHGLTMGLDVCATFHMGIEPHTLRRLTESVVERAAPAYLMAVAGNADPMLGYLTTSFREHPRLRRLTGRQMTSVMSRRLAGLGVLDDGSQAAYHDPGPAGLYAMYMKAGGDRRSHETLQAEAAKKIGDMRQRGFDIGYGSGPGGADPPEAHARIEAIYRNARRALYAGLDDAVLRDASPQHARVRTLARDRDDYLSHPGAGEVIREEDAARLTGLYTSSRPLLQIVISDGLNANAVNVNIRAVLPALKRRAASAGYPAGEIDVIIQNGRVRAGYHVGKLLGASAVVHFIGERPGTGIDTLSAYITYGLDPSGDLRWRPDLDHSDTTAICGINRRGKDPVKAVDEIVRCVGLMFEERRSGVALGSKPSI